MRLLRIAPGHVLLRPRTAARWLLLALAALLGVFAIWQAFALGLPGALAVALVLGALFAVGVAVAVRARDELELGPEQVRRTRRGPWRWRAVVQCRGREAVGAVTLRATVERGVPTRDAPPRASYEVGLVGDAPWLAELRLFAHPREMRARTFATELCGAADLPLVDLTGEAPDRREVHALAGPPGRRATGPAGLPPRGLTVDPDPVYGEVATFARWWGRRTRTWVADGELHVARAWFTVPLRDHRLAVAAVERVRVECREGTSQHLREAIAVVGAFGVLRFGGGLGLEARRWLRAWLEARLWPELRQQRAADAPVAEPLAAGLAAP